jgi:ATP-binding cassette subfamily F protein 3
VISLQDINFGFGGNYLYQDASWHIKPGERIGLIGQNGRGKTTLLRVITGEYGIESGVISKQNNMEIGFLNQDLLSQETDATILEMAMQAFSRQVELEKEIDEIIHQLETNYHEDLVHKLGDKQHEFENLDGYNIRYKAEQVLEGLGFKTADLNRPVKEFSGGWRMRAMLAQMLLKKPELLMLDEPTNHLDLPTIQWIEEYLQGYPGAIIVISHDRYFLNNVCNKIVEISNKKFNIYPGNYDFYMREKAERNDLQQRQFANQQQYIKEQEKFIDRFRAKASKSTAVQSRVKMLDKLDVIDAPESDEAFVNMKFKVSKQPGKVIYSFSHLYKKYGTQEIFRNISGEILRGDKIALVGANGLGKSTLLKILAKHTDFEGKLEEGYNVATAFYAQHQLESLNLENNILDEVGGYAPHLKETEVRTLLGCFLFSGDEVFKKIKVLSGGEKSRVALAKTISGDANFMLLDEPTNHLDFQSVNILIEALKNYEGSMLIVSHDRHFVSKLANKIWFIEEHELKEYPGTYDEWNEWMKRREVEKKNMPQEKKTITGKAVEPTKVNKEPHPKNNKNLEKKMAELEAAISLKKEMKSHIEKEFEKPENIASAEKMKELNADYQKVFKELDTLEVDFENVFSEMMENE